MKLVVKLSDALVTTQTLLIVGMMMFMVVGCGPQEPADGPEKADELARGHILGSDQYSQYDGSELELTHSEELACDGCYRLTYRFTSPEEGVDGFGVKVLIEDGTVKNVSYEMHTAVTSFAECEDAGFEVLYPDCQGCPDVCVTPDGQRFEKLQGCVDKCGDGSCAQIVCQADGCPCPETPESCPEDCGDGSRGNDEDRLCVDMCGDGRCQEVVCMGEDCPCEESRRTCPEDCS